MIFREIPPSAGLPLRLKDFSVLFKAGSGGCLAEDFKKYIGASYARVVCSGTAALYFILETLKELSDKRTVVIPSYICTLVPLAVKRAGLKVEVCDIGGKDFNYDDTALKDICSGNDDILAILAVHLAGIPVDIDSVRETAAGKKIFIIEDCAQSLGAAYKGKRTGALGDFSFFSLCRGKGLTIYEGGVVVTESSRYAAALDRTIERLEKADLLSEALKVLELFGYWLFYRPLFFWFIHRLPEIFWRLLGKRYRAEGEYFDNINFPTHTVSYIRKAIGHSAFSRLDEAIALQRRKASFYTEALKGAEGIRIIKERPGASPSAPYVMLILDEPERREEVLRMLGRSGLGISYVYSSAIADYPYLKDVVGGADCPNARRLAAGEITLSTSGYLSPGDLEAIVNSLRLILYRR